MSYIHLLPENTANQIAAGEVVQRPASVVKELLENAVDAGSDHIRLYIKNGGITFIQVEDNGKGMDPADARMCWERHATSKIQKAEDLYDLSTLGFRGEALASIASVSDVEMRTKTREMDHGTLIELHAGSVVDQSVTACKDGTSITVKNLFYNIPARKNFLKSITVETKHIFDEFQRIALAYPNISFDLYNQDKEVHRLPATDLKGRIKGLFNLDEEHLINCSEDTEIVKIHGFVGGPKLAKRTRGTQFLFANGRFIKDPYLNHAIGSAYSSLIDDKQYPFYALFLDVNPAKIDVNIHPTKHEVKFEDSKHVYSFLNAIVKKSLGKFYVLPTADHLLPFDRTTERDPRAFITSQPNKRFNPFEPSKERVRTEWEKLDELLRTEPVTTIEQREFFEQLSREPLEIGPLFQIAEAYIVVSHQGELWLINQHRAHEQVLYERYRNSEQKMPTQQLLFPRTLELNNADFSLFQDLEEEIQQLGFDVGEFGGNTIIINGLPSDLSKEDGAQVLQDILEEFKQTYQKLRSDKKEALLQAAAKNSAIKAGKHLTMEEMKQLVSDLLHCEQNKINPKGASIVVKFDKQNLDRLFN